MTKTSPSSNAVSLDDFTPIGEWRWARTQHTAGGLTYAEVHLVDCEHELLTKRICNLTIEDAMFLTDMFANVLDAATEGKMLCSPGQLSPSDDDLFHEPLSITVCGRVELLAEFLKVDAVALGEFRPTLWNFGAAERALIHDQAVRARQVNEQVRRITRLREDTHGRIDRPVSQETPMSYTRIFQAARNARPSSDALAAKRLADLETARRAAERQRDAWLDEGQRAHSEAKAEERRRMATRLRQLAEQQFTRYEPEPQQMADALARAIAFGALADDPILCAEFWRIYVEKPRGGHAFARVASAVLNRGETPPPLGAEDFFRVGAKVVADVIEAASDRGEASDHHRPAIEVADDGSKVRVDDKEYEFDRLQQRKTIRRLFDLAKHGDSGELVKELHKSVAPNANRLRLDAVFRGKSGAKVPGFKALIVVEGKPRRAKINPEVARRWRAE